MVPVDGGRMQCEPLLVRHCGLVRHEHGGRAEHVAERVVHEVQERRRIQVRVPHHLTRIIY